METIRELINQTAQKYSDKAALIFENKRYTFKQVNQRVNRLANALASIGVRKGDKVGILACNSSQYFEVFGVTKAGIVCVPFNWRSVGRELVYLANDSEINTLFVEGQFIDIVNSIRGEISGVKNLICLDATVANMMNYEQFIGGFPPDEPAGEISGDDPSVILYTSGTTGQPKGSVHTHKSFVAEVSAPGRELTSKDIALSVMPFFHIGGSMAYLFPSFFAGATTVILKRFDPVSVLEAIEKEKVTSICLVPTMIAALLEHPKLNNYDLSSLRTIIYTGSPIPPSTLKRGIGVFGDIFIQVLGQTETGMLTLLSKDDHKFAISHEETRRLESTGKPVAADIRIVDGRNKRVAVGKVGEIVVRSARTMKEYWKQPEATAMTIKNGWLHTGDLGRQDKDGYIYLVDRAKDMIISGGENIYSREVEDVLCSHPAVLEAAVVGVPDEKWGESVKAVIVLREGMTATSEEVIEFSKKHLASYKKPKSVEFWKSLPKTPNGKVLKNEIRDRYWQGNERRIH